LFDPEQSSDLPVVNRKRRVVQASLAIEFMVCLETEAPALDKRFFVIAIAACRFAGHLGVDGMAACISLRGDFNREATYCETEAINYAAFQKRAANDCSSGPVASA